MSNAVEFVSFDLKAGVSIPDFLLASDKMNDEFLIMQKGYISRKLLRDDRRWADLVLWETLEDAQNAADAFGKSDVGGEYACLIENIDFHDFSEVKRYG